MKKAIYSLFLSYFSLHIVHATDDVFTKNTFRENDQSKSIFIALNSHQAINQEANANDTNHHSNVVLPESIFKIAQTEIASADQKYYLEQKFNEKLKQNPEDIQRKLAEEHDRELTDYSILRNRFYENERIRIFNYSAYSIRQLKTSLFNPASTNLDADNFYISFGYGIEFKMDKFNTIGYEYISSFPYDRGQLLRFFWKRSLSY